MTLTVIEIKSAKPKEKPYKMADEKGLYLLVNPNGSTTHLATPKIIFTT